MVLLQSFETHSGCSDFAPRPTKNETGSRWIQVDMPTSARAEVTQPAPSSYNAYVYIDSLTVLYKNAMSIAETMR
jgi:hypothetical protein